MLTCRSTSPEDFSGMLSYKRRPKPKACIADDPDYKPVMTVPGFARDYTATAGVRLPLLERRGSQHRDCQRSSTVALRKPHTARLQFWTNVSP